MACFRKVLQISKYPSFIFVTVTECLCQNTVVDDDENNDFLHLNSPVTRESGWFFTEFLDKELDLSKNLPEVRQLGGGWREIWLCSLEHLC